MYEAIDITYICMYISGYTVLSILTVTDTLFSLNGIVIQAGSSIMAKHKRRQQMMNSNV